MEGRKRDREEKGVEKEGEKGEGQGGERKQGEERGGEERNILITFFVVVFRNLLFLTFFIGGVTINKTQTLHLQVVRTCVHVTTEYVD